MNATDASCRIVPSLTAVARHYGRHPQSVKTWRQSGMPGPPWDLDVIDAWIASTRRRTPAEVAAAQQAAAEADAARRTARADRERLAAARELGEVLTADDLQVRLAIAVGPLLDRLHKIVSAIGEHWFGKQSTPDLLRLVNELIREPFAGETAEAAIIAVATKLGRGEPLIAKSAKRRRKP